MQINAVHNRTTIEKGDCSTGKNNFSFRDSNTVEICKSMVKKDFGKNCFSLYACIVLISLNSELHLC